MDGLESTGADAPEAVNPPAAAPDVAAPPGAAAAEAPKPRRPMPAVTTGRRSYRRTYGTMRVGSVLGRTLSIYGKNALAFSLISLVVHLPLLAYTWWTFDIPDPRTEAELMGAFQRAGLWAVAYLIGGLLLGHIAAGPVTYGVVERLRGRRPGVGACLGQGFRRLPRVLGVAGLLTVYFIGLFLLLVLILVPVAGTLFGRTEVGQVVATLVFGFPALSVLSVFWVAVPVAVIEEKGSRGAMGRSAHLTSRNFWKAFGVLALFFLGEQIFDRLVASVMSEPRHFVAVRNLKVMQVGLSALLFGPLQAVASAIGYHDLRTSSEGIDSEQLASVFD